MARRRGGAPHARAEGHAALAAGVYEHLVTEALAEDLRRTLDAPAPLRALEATLDDADAHIALARHLGGELERALATLPREQRVERARAVTATLLEQLAALQTDEALAADLRAQQLSPPARRLLALHHGEAPERPTSPLGISTLLTRNRNEPSLGHELGRELALADRVDAILAFITVGGVRSVEPELHRFANRPGARLRLLTTVFTGTTQVAALDALARLPGAEVKVSYDTRRTRLHAKAWLFHRDTGLTTAYVGSANLTSTALGAGQEWMVKIAARDLPHVIDKFEGTFETLWADPEFEIYDPESAEHRERLAHALSAQTTSADDASRFLVSLRALPFQAEILDRLAAERAVHQRRRNLIVAATGTGKTVIAALDYARQVAANGGVPPRLLFLAHREELLLQARRTFQHALQDASFGELLVEGHRPRHHEHVFASIQSVAASDLIARLGAAHFRYVVIDECHHVPAASYRAVMAQLTPELLVGLTATPERSDGKSLLPDFDGHVAAELRLWHALDDQLLVPFEYFGISDGVDLRRVRWSRAGYDAGTLGELYTGHTARADLIRHQLARRVADVRAVRALGFCVSVAHAEYMAQQFSAAGIPARAVHGASPDELRASAPRLLRDRQVNVLFTCDLYNEGVDLPFVDTLLMLRPTQSATLFLQQLGRGLRHFPGKTSCLVLDFIGQHREEFRFDTVFAALTGTPRPRLRKALEEGFPYLPSGCALKLDAVARDAILRSLQDALAGAARLSAELRELSAAAEAPLTIAQFLDDTGRELEEIYDAGGWTPLRRRAGLLENEAPHAAHEVTAVDDLSRRLGWLLHVDEPARLRTYREVLREPSPALDASARLRLQMLEHQLNPRGVQRTAEQLGHELRCHAPIADELRQLSDVLEDRVALAEQRQPVPAWPLALHRHYTRREIAAAVGFTRPGKKGVALQAGVLKLPAADGEPHRELLFVTLDKSGKAFSPTTRYRDYAVSPQLFHWETQSAASVTRPSGRRYLEGANAAEPWQFYLFVRPDPEAAYAFLGRVHYQSHSGDRPIAILWRLEHAMPGALYDRYATLRQ
jgi:superfamily II DNA or RNA helicase/HKD family nuclease